MKIGNFHVVSGIRYPIVEVKSLALRFVQLGGFGNV